mgnify:FL=1|jgi:hypothetical protein
MSVASAIYNETCHICEVISQTLKSITKTIIIGRQYSANRIVAQQLIDLGEYRGQPLDVVVAELNERTKAEWK